MWLLNARTLKLTPFFDANVPLYAILSHRWETEEVTFQDIQDPSVQRKAGYDKIIRCCRQAIQDGYDFAWIDTCCIDKTSSAELSEAINSMFQWYKNAAVCYAYLSDVHISEIQPYWLYHWVNKPDLVTKFKCSQWFTRGWTLQELIAPLNLVFFDSNWTKLGNKESLSLLLSLISGVDQDSLTGGDIRRASIARRMSWASSRVTTRKEDIAYSLIGIFGVNMPLMYGEGEKAFIRLQEEIMKDSDDQSLFAWENQEVEDPSVVHGPDGPLRGPLARSPSEFANSGNIVPYRDWQRSLPHNMTNQGLRIELPIHIVRGDDTGLCLAVLGCHYDGDFRGPLGIFLRPLRLSNRNRYNDGLEGDQYARDHKSRRPIIVDPTVYFRPTTKTIYLRKDILLPTHQEFDRQYSFLIRLLPQNYNFKLSYIYPRERWTKAKNNVAIIRWPTCKGAVLFQGPAKAQFLITVRIDLPIPYQENDRWDRSRCTCKIFVLEPQEKIIGNASRLFSCFEILARCGSNKTFEYLQNGLMVIAEIKKEIVMGERMLVVDLDIQNTRVNAVTVPRIELEGDREYDRDGDQHWEPNCVIRSLGLHELP